jgi:tryptophanyl-tRNA synthetase
MLANAHSFKDKSANLADVNAGLFVYPVLMAADIIMYNANYVPVGKDQIQHIEIARDIASKFNHQYNDDVFVLPEAKVDDKVMTIPGIDGRKMSKSYNNYINIFMPDKALKKQIMKIVTDETPLEDPKNPDTCNVFTIYSLLANPEQIATMRANYEGGNYGYGHAKVALFELIVEKFKEPREKYAYYMENTLELENLLAIGAAKAKAVAIPVLNKVKEKLGF